MRAPPSCGRWFLDTSTVAVRGVLSISVRRSANLLFNSSRRMSASIARLKVTLRHVRPPVWRRVEVSTDTTLFGLHRLIQNAMGWGDGHLHQFIQRGVYYGQSDDENDFHRENERRVRIKDLLRQPKDRL